RDPRRDHEGPVQGRTVRRRCRADAEDHRSAGRPGRCPGSLYHRRPGRGRMKILVIGSGGREHALAWRLAQSPRVHKVFVAPGNGGTATGQQLENIPLTQIDDLITFARDEAVAYTIVGPEAPLAAGIVDKFRAANLKIFGPTQAAARLES